MARCEVVVEGRGALDCVLDDRSVPDSGLRQDPESSEVWGPHPRRRSDRRTEGRGAETAQREGRLRRAEVVGDTCLLCGPHPGAVRGQGPGGRESGLLSGFAATVLHGVPAPGWWLVGGSAMMDSRWRLALKGGPGGASFRTEDTQPWSLNPDSFPPTPSISRVTMQVPPMLCLGRAPPGFWMAGHLLTVSSRGAGGGASSPVSSHTKGRSRT